MSHDPFQFSVAMAPTRRRPLLQCTLFALACLPIPVPVLSATVFNFTSFTPNTAGIRYAGDAHASGGDQAVIQLTRNQLDESLEGSAGHAVYAEPFDLYDAGTGTVSDFATTFKFKIVMINDTVYGDGLAFFIAPVGYELKNDSGGGALGLFNWTTYNTTNFVAVEFDTFKNYWDPDGNHVGIDVNSIVSNATVPFPGDMKDARVWTAKVSYESSSNNLSVRLMYPDEERTADVPILSYNVNLKEVLPPKVVVGFSASTGRFLELHQILSWDFVADTDTDTGKGQVHKTGSSKKHVPWVVAITMCVLFVVAAFGYTVYVRRWQRKKKSLVLTRDPKYFGSQNRDRSGDEPDRNFDLDSTSLEGKMFIAGGGSRRFSYKELVVATMNFCEERKLGQGGFGGVYLGYVGASVSEKIAVKKISRDSNQGKKEFVSEVTAISQLRHPNLVRLIGWCHEYGELLLVYEYMINGSLDTHLFGKTKMLAWALRYKIAVGLATALLYLHEEWEQCVVHRDVKASNVMLDSDFNAKLGDFGLARLVDHAIGGQTTMLAGTMGYLAPECVMTGRASKESDVYSFGVVALEIACGRKSIDPMAALAEVKLVDWVWEHYGRGTVLAAADQRLNGDYDNEQTERMMVLGLWCTHPDSKLRPSIREAIQVLTFKAPVPSLPKTIPKPMYSPLPMNMINILYDTRSEDITAVGTVRYDGQCNTSSQTSSASTSDINPFPLTNQGSDKYPSKTVLICT